jgi:hypothetical protein
VRGQCYNRLNTKYERLQVQLIVDQTLFNIRSIVYSCLFTSAHFTYVYHLSSMHISYHLCSVLFMLSTSLMPHAVDTYLHKHGLLLIFYSVVTKYHSILVIFASCLQHGACRVLSRYIYKLYSITL